MNHQKHENIEKTPLFEHPRMLFFLVSFCLYIGTISGSFGGQKESFYGILVIILIFVLFCKIRTVFIICILLMSGIGGYLLSTHTYNKRIENIVGVMQISSKHQKNKPLYGTIEKPLYTGELKQAYIVNIDNFDTISPQDSINIGIEKYKILLEIPKNLTLSVGDTIKFNGTIKPLFLGSIDGFEKYSFFQGVGGKISISNFERMSSGESSKLEAIKNWTQNHIYSGFPRDIAGVILGMTIGDVELMSKDIQESFRTSGISHILVVSGSNITFLIVLVSGILKYLPLQKTLRIGIIFVFVLLYSTLVGWDVPVIRSTIMGLIGFFAMEQKTKVSSLAILLAVANIYVISSPLSLCYDPAFGLSFGATVSIILFYNGFYTKCKSWKIPESIGSILAITIAASLGTLPVSLYHFGNISFGFFFANIAITFVVGWILFCSVIYILFGFLGEFFLYIFGIIVYLPVKYIIFIADFFSSWGYIDIAEWIKFPLVILGISFLSSRLFNVAHLHQSKVKKEPDH